MRYLEIYEDVILKSINHIRIKRVIDFCDKINDERYLTDIVHERKEVIYEIQVF